VIVSLAAAPLASVTVTVTATDWGASGQKNLVSLAVASANVPTGAPQRYVSSSLFELDVVTLTRAPISGAAGSGDVEAGSERWFPAGVSASTPADAGAAGGGGGEGAETLPLGNCAPRVDCVSAGRGSTR